ncbi:hypothetical protein V865_007292 [Kwoniella europaea PYCC6329]|uniref:Uncharacterized protein n=1 Tax=Kwoniella europaea PYCC6329 TaxID=1423913 RepID=A0AAX4KRX9_9TREE
MPPIRRDANTSSTHRTITNNTDLWRQYTSREQSYNLISRSHEIRSPSHADTTTSFNIQDHFPPSHIATQPYNDFRVRGIATNPSTGSTAIVLVKRSDGPPATENSERPRATATLQAEDAINTLCTVLKSIPSQGRMTDGVRFKYDDRSVEAFRGDTQRNTWSAIISDRDLPKDRLIGRYTVKVPDDKDRSAFDQYFNQIASSAIAISPAMEMDLETEEEKDAEVVQKKMSSLSIDHFESSVQKVNQSINNWTRDTGYDHNLVGHHHFTLNQVATDTLRETNASINGFFDLLWVPKLKNWNAFHQFEIANSIGTALPVDVNGHRRITDFTAWTQSQDGRTSVLVKQRPHEENEGDRISWFQIGEK